MKKIKKLKIGCSLNDYIRFATKIGIQFSKHYIWKFGIHFEIIILSLHCIVI